MAEPAPIHIYAPSEPDEPKEPKKRRCKLPDFLRAADWDRLISTAASEIVRAPLARERRAAQRDEIVIHLALYCGLRISEICNLDVEHVDLAARRLFVCEGKGCKDRFVAIPTRLIDKLREWMAGKSTGAILVADSGKRLCARTLCWRLKRLGKLAGLTKHLHCHLLRHSYAVRLLETGADIRQIQELLGHASLAQTSVYLHCDTSRLLESVDRL